MKIPFARGNVDKMKDIALEANAMDLPSIVMFRKLDVHVYRGVQTNESMTAYVKKLTGKPLKQLKSIDDVNDFIEYRNSSAASLSTSMVIGFFSGKNKSSGVRLLMTH